jgi:hypothetical protein
VDRNVRVPPTIVSVPGGFATLVPPVNVPRELVKPPGSAYANANGMKMAKQARAKVFFNSYFILSVRIPQASRRNGASPKKRGLARRVVFGGEQFSNDHRGS